MMDLTNITKKLTDATTALAKADNDLKLEIAGAAADAAGLVDPTPASDIVGAGISIARGDYWGAALSTVSMVPYLGDAVAKPVKAVRATKAIAGLEKKIATLTKTVNDLKKAKKEAEAVETTAKEAKLAKEADAVKESAAKQEKAAPKKDKDCEDCKTPSDAPKKTVPKTPYRGGAHSETKLPVGDGLDSHHLPADAISPIPREKGPAIKMDPADHRETSSNGSGLDAIEYRAEVKELLDADRMRDAMAKEIRDVRRAADVVSGKPTKYNEGIQEMLEYSKKMGWLDKKGK